MTRRLGVFVLAALLGSTFGPKDASAGQILVGSTRGALSLHDLARRAELVVIGHVVSIHSAWDPSLGTIVTSVQCAVAETLKGDADARVVFRQPGGRVGDVTSAVPDAPTFRVGERVLLFLARGRQGFFQVVAMFQGKFSVEREPGAALDVAVRRVPDSGEVLDRIPLDRARAEIRAAAGDRG